MFRIFPRFIEHSRIKIYISERSTVSDGRGGEEDEIEREETKLINSHFVGRDGFRISR